MDYMRDSYRSLFAKLLPSAIGAMLSESVASLIDTVILSYYLGTDMLATVNICMPVYMTINMLSMLIVSGGATLFAQSLGREDPDEASRCYTCSLMIMVLCGAVMTAVGLIWTEPILRLLGAEDTILVPTTGYAKVLFMFMIPLMLYQQMLVYVRFDGAPMLSLASTLVCGVVNLILDVLFVGPLGWGHEGAALATCLAYTLAMLINATHLLSKKNRLRFQRKSLRAERIVRVAKVGFPIAVTQLGMAIGTALFNKRIMQVGGIRYLDAYGILVQLTTISMALYEGIGQACQPIMAASVGAGNRKRLFQTVQHGVRIEIIAMVLGTLAYILGAGVIADLYSIKTEAERLLTVSAVRIYALSLLFTGMNTMIIYYYQVQEKEINASGISLLSGTVFPVLFLYSLTAVMGAEGAWWCYLIAQGCTLILSMRLFLKDYRKQGLAVPS